MSQRMIRSGLILTSFLPCCLAASLIGADLPALGYQPDPSERGWKANWIWLAGEEYSVDARIQARKEFELGAVPRQAELRISAYSDYIVYINGSRVGRGPEWNDPEYQTYDAYDVRSYLRTGTNVVAIVAHNFAIGTHWSRRNRGGLIAELDFDDRKSVETDSTWKLHAGHAWAVNSPRIFWSAGFLETFDFNRYDSRWTSPGFDDADWQSPEVLGKPPVQPWIRLLRRQIPLLKETMIPASGVEKGNSAVPPFHAVRFGSILPAGKPGIVYAQTVLPAKGERDIAFRIQCDDAFKLFLNGEVVASLRYDEYFARTRLWNGKDEYDQAHYGMGTVQYGRSSDKPEYGEHVPGILHLKRGGNRLVMVVDQGTSGWGFLLSFFDPKTRLPIDIDFGTGTTTDRTWTLAGPYQTTELSDSLDYVKSDIEALQSNATVKYSPFDYSEVTDYATLMDAEKRQGTPLTGASVVLNEGEYAIFDLAKIYAGFPELEIQSGAGGVVDVGYTEALTPDRRVRLAAYGSMRYVDRVILKNGSQTWQPFDRRTARYLHLVCRRGRAISIHVKGFDAIGYPAKLLASFESSDPLLNRIWETAVYTAQLVMQQGYQDCLKREQGTLNTSSFNFTSKGAAYSFGDYALARKNLVQALRTQDRTGWFDSHGVSSPNSDEPTECLWWAVWLRDYYQQSGDLDLVRELFPGLEDNLRYFTKGINQFGLIEGGNQPIRWRGQGIYIDDSAESGNYEGLFDGELVGMNQLYAAALHSAAYLAGELKLDARAQLYERRAARADQSISNRFWDTEKQLFRDWRLGSQLATTHHPIFQITALYFELASDQQKQQVLQYLINQLGFPSDDRPDYPLTTFGYYHYFLDVLFRYGQDAKALELMRRVYGRWLELGTTTFGEFFRPADLKGKHMLDTEYEVHAYGASALNHFYSNILGIRPAEPGFRKISIAPHPGDLHWARGNASTPKGMVKMSWRIEAGVFYMDVELPEGCGFEVHAPKGFTVYQVRINGNVVPLREL